MTTLVSADLQLADGTRDAYRLDFLDRLPKLAQEHKAERVLLLGDITEVKDAHRAGLTNRIVDGVAALAQVAHVYVLKGNHDYVAEDVPFFRFLNHMPRVRWINKPTPLKLRGLGNCLFLPHTRSLEDWVDLMFDSYDWFFCHQTFRGAKNEHGRPLEGPASPFPKGARVVAGDVHVPQDGAITYVGAPYTVDFGDDFKPRVLLLDGDRMRSIPVTGPQKRLVEVDSLDHLLPKARLLRGVNRGDIVKVRVNLAGGDEPALGRAEVRRIAREWADRAGVALHTVEILSAAPAAARTKKRAPTASDADLVREYAKRMGKDKTTIAAGLKIMEEVV